MLRAIHLGALVAMMLLGCQPTVRDDQYRCSVEDDCPPGMACFPSGFCSRGVQGPVDGGVRTDAFTVDASPAFDAPVRIDVFVNATPDAFARDAHVPSDAPNLLSEGFICTTDAQCSAGLTCAPNPMGMTPRLSSCRPACSGDAECGPNGWCSEGACNRACDPIARDCLGDSTCQFRGDASQVFVCALLVPAPMSVGGSCDGSFGQCASGLVCDEPGVCRQLCDVALSGCPSPSTCVAESPAVIWRGRQFGFCRP